MAKLSYKEIAEAIYKATDGKTGKELHAELANVVNFLNKKRLISKSSEILAELKKIVNKKEGRIEAKITYAKKLSGNAKHHIEHALKKRYKAKDVVLVETEDTSLIGGFKVEAEEEVIDLSIKNKINKLQEHLIAN